MKNAEKGDWKRNPSEVFSGKINEIFLTKATLLKGGEYLLANLKSVREQLFF